MVFYNAISMLPKGILIVSSHNVRVERVLIDTFRTANVTAERFVKVVTAHVNRVQHGIAKVDVTMSTLKFVVVIWPYAQLVLVVGVDDAIITCCPDIVRVLAAIDVIHK